MIAKVLEEDNWNSYCTFFDENGKNNLWQSPQWYQFMKATNRNPEVFVLSEKNKIFND